MPKAPSTCNKPIRRSGPLKSTIQCKSSTRTRTQVGRAKSRTTKTTEELVRPPSPTPPTPVFPSGLPEFTPTEDLDAVEQEQEQEKVKVQKGPSRAVSVSFSPMYRGVAQLTSRNRRRYSNGSPSVQGTWTTSSVWTASVVVLSSVPFATNLAPCGAGIALVSKFIVKNASSNVTLSFPSIALRYA